jgi:hypothetical protein
MKSRLLDAVSALLICLPGARPADGPFGHAD